MKKSNRRGVLLLVVLALLAMFAMVAVAFVVLTGVEKTNSDRLRTIDAVTDPPQKLLNEAGNIVFRGVPCDPACARSPHLRHQVAEPAGKDLRLPDDRYRRSPGDDEQPPRWSAGDN